MSVNDLCWVLCIYVFAYYLLARDVLIELKRTDPGYFNDSYRLNTEVGMGTSMDIGRMLFANDLPKPEYTRYVRYGLWGARLLLAGFLPVAVILGMFFVHFSERERQ